ncbi:MAG: hypothetical protein FWG10_01900 [Eubacteriaceae bacterium]|nr:hypothetical protein [Eubacteriaceae bacterium]
MFQYPETVKKMDGGVEFANLAKDCSVKPGEWNRMGQSGDCSYNTDGGVFNSRVGVIIQHDGKSHGYKQP